MTKNNEYNKLYRKRHKDKILKRARLWYRLNSDKVKQYKKNNHKNIYRYNKNYRVNNPKKVKIWSKRYIDKNKYILKIKAKKWRRDNPDKARNIWLKYQYGISLAQYNKIFIKQKGRCAICKMHHAKLSRSLAVDHCHKSLKVRGLLCDPCNKGLGNFCDNYDNLVNASNYIKKYGNK